MEGLQVLSTKNFSTLASRKNKYVGQKINKGMEIVKMIYITGLEKFESQANVLNLVENDQIWKFL